MGSHRNLKAWQHAHRLAVRCKKLADGFPAEARFELGAQLRTAAAGAALTIAEGSGRRGAAEFRRFLVMARASLDEVEAALELARDYNYLSSEEYLAAEALRDEAARTLFGLIQSVERHLSRK